MLTNSGMQLPHVPHVLVAGAGAAVLVGVDAAAVGGFGLVCLAFL